MEGNSGICGQTPWGRILFHQCSCICMCGYEYVSMSMCMLSKGFAVKEMFYSRFLSWCPFLRIYFFCLPRDNEPDLNETSGERESERGTVNIWNQANHERQCRSTTGADLYVWGSALCKTAVVHPKWHIPIKSSHWFDSGVCKVVFCVCVCAHQARGETNFSPWFWCLLLCDVLYINNMFL